MRGCCGINLAQATFIHLSLVCLLRRTENMNLSFVGKCIGRGTFFILTVIQGLFLSSYAEKYTENDYWYGIALSLYCPSMILVALPCVTQTTQNKFKPSWPFGVWALNPVFGLIPSISIVFGVAGYLQTLNTTVNDTLCDTLIGASNATTNLTLCDGLLKASYDLCSLRAPILTVNNDSKTLDPTLLKGALCNTTSVAIVAEHCKRCKQE